MSKKISQLEARRLKKRVQELERREESRFALWGSDYPYGTQICALALDPKGVVSTAIKTARRLGNAIVVTVADDGTVYFFALSGPRTP